MFKKSPNVKPSAAIKNSECRRLRSMINAKFIPGNGRDEGVNRPDPDSLLPDGVRSSRFSTHSQDRSGILHTSSDNVPLWFTFLESKDMVPTLYTLWRLEILPILTTSSEAIERILEGADLMIPGVIESHEDGNIPNIPLNGFVAVAPARSRIPVAVGRMAISTGNLRSAGRGKAVHILHTYKDSLWSLGPGMDPPISIPTIEGVDTQSHASDHDPQNIDPENGLAVAVGQLSIQEQGDSTGGDAEVGQELNTEEADELLRLALIQAITIVSKFSTTPFPLSSSTFYSAHILPSRPAPAGSQSSTPSDLIKRSSFKKLSKFLQHAEKASLLKLKDMKGDLNILSINVQHPDVIAHRPFRTMADVEAQKARKEKAAKEESERVQPMVIKELYKPNGPTRRFFHEGVGITGDVYTVGDLKPLMDAYITKHELIHPREPSYVILDAMLREVLLDKKEDMEFLKRDELMPRLRSAMQSWYSIEVPGKVAMLKKGELKPISVKMKVRAGRKACTLISGFGEYSIAPEFLSEELRKSCACATSVTELPGKGGKQVMVQGKHSKEVVDTLINQGIPKKWIEVHDETQPKKK